MLTLDRTKEGCSGGDRPLVFLPARFHAQDIPVPYGHEPARARAKPDPDRIVFLLVPRFRGRLNPQSGSGNGLQEHQCRYQIQEQYGNHNEGHVIAVILSHFCVPRMINASGSKQLLFQNRDTSDQGRSVHARPPAARCLMSHALAYAHGFGGSEYVRKAQPVPWHTRLR